MLYLSQKPSTEDGQGSFASTSGSDLGLARETLQVMRAAGGMGVCDMHSVITDYCGMGYKTCDIAQCAGPPTSMPVHVLAYYAYS